MDHEEAHNLFQSNSTLIIIRGDKVIRNLKFYLFIYNI